MSQPLDSDLMDDLDEPEGRSMPHALDEGDLGDLGDPLESDPFESSDELDFDAADAMDELEDAVTEALEAEDADEFLGNIFRAVRNVAKKVAPIVSKVAPLIPIPGAGLIGKAADIVGQVAADEGDELDALEGLVENADEADEFDAAAPIAAALAVRKAIPNAAHIPHPQRKQLVKAATAATRHIAQRHGPAATVAVPAIVRHARRVAVQRGVPARQLPQLVRRTAAKVAQSPQLVRRFARASQNLRTMPAGGGMAGGGIGMWGSPAAGGGMSYGRRGMGRRRRMSMYGWDGDDTGGYRGMTPYRRRGTRWGRYGYGGGGYGDRHIALRPGSRIVIESI